MSILIAIAAIGVILWTLPLLLELLGFVISAGIWLIGAALAVAAVVGVVLFLGSNPELLGLAIVVIVGISLLSFFFRGLDSFTARRRLRNITPESRSNNVIEHVPD